MSRQVLLTDDAARDLDELFATSHLRSSSQTPESLDLFLDRFQSAFEQLAEDPEEGGHPPELLGLGIRDYRELSVDSHRLIYRVNGEEIWVLLIVSRERAMQSLLQRRLLEG